MKTLRLFSLLIMATLLPACSMLAPPPTAPLPGEDPGPKPNAHAFVAAWANRNYGTRSAYWTPQQIIVGEPVAVAYNDPVQGRKVGWMIEIGPENRDLSNCIGFPSSRMIVNRGRVIWMESR
jgi:hypothetical protein